MARGRAVFLPDQRALCQVPLLGDRQRDRVVDPSDRKVVEVHSLNDGLLGPGFREIERAARLSLVHGFGSPVARRALFCAAPFLRVSGEMDASEIGDDAHQNIGDVMSGAILEAKDQRLIVRLCYFADLSTCTTTS